MPWTNLRQSCKQKIKNHFFLLSLFRLNDNSLPRFSTFANCQCQCTRCQFHQQFERSFYTRRSQKRKIDSQVIGHFALLGSAHVKSRRNYVGDIDPRIVAVQLRSTHSMSRHSISNLWM